MKWLTLIFACILLLGENASAVKLASVALIVAGVAGLNLAGET